ncbi:MAG TPA: NAD(P)/FAD-dependent oxidoreductase [Terricaulis sp.]|nr:NAD(P)/FAD-dependent oxidoreductase [Terricaulis sp.]
MSEHVDVLIIGAGLSGIGAGYYLQRDCPNKSYLILENREAIGGTWDLFRYPGVRSDSDMFTLGYAFKPWNGEKAIADGPSIWEYVNETAREYGIDQRVRFKRRVARANWSSSEALWHIEAEHEGGVEHYTANFLISCAGYYDYEQGYAPDFPGANRFAGHIIHPQHWPEHLDYSGQRVIVIGSGATAVTLAPSMAERAAHVTMLQRSPTYMISMPAVDPIANAMRKALPKQFAYDATRFLRIVLQQIFFRLARARPEKTRTRLLGLIREELGPDYDMAHFTPRYNPWEERLCLVPDNDMFAAIRAGKVELVTDHIESFTETGVQLASGKHLPADIIVTATGLNLRIFGGAAISVDGAAVQSGELYAYKGCMFSGVPNMINVFGYTNASWTLRADLINQFACRLINYMDKHGLAAVTPRITNPEALQERPFVDFSSGYFQRAKHLLPKQTAKAPWKQNQSYAHDLIDLRFGKLEDGALEFSKRPARAA